MNTVLLAEDDPVSQAFLREALASLGYACTAVADGAEALRIARRQAFGLLLLDVNLPGCSGPALLARLRSDSSAVSTAARAIALTADTLANTRRTLLESGFDAVGNKPISIQSLAELVGEVSGSQSAHAPCWDDAQAMAVAGGQRDIVDSLRLLMLRDLPRQRDAILAAVAAAAPDLACAELHRLQAACGFCGATSLRAHVDALHDALRAGKDANACVVGFERAVEAQLAAQT